MPSSYWEGQKEEYNRVEKLESDRQRSAYTCTCTEEIRCLLPKWFCEQAVKGLCVHAV